MNATSPYAIALRGDTEAILRRICAYIATLDPGARLRWRIQDLETNPDLESPRASISTDELLELFAGQVIELNAIAETEGAMHLRIIVRDGLTVDLLGHGTPPTVFDLGTRYTVEDPARFYWE